MTVFQICLKLKHCYFLDLLHALWLSSSQVTIGYTVFSYTTNIIDVQLLREMWAAHVKSNQNV